MARFDQNPFPNVTDADYANYQKWPAVTLPDGQTVYEVPGNPGYVLDPVASNATGRKVFRANPKGAITKQKEAEDQQKRLIDQQEMNGSPAGQLIPVAGTIGGAYAVNKLTQTVEPVKETAEKIQEIQIADQTAAQAPSSFGQAAAGSQPATPTGLTGNITSSGGATPVGTATNGGTMMSDGSISTNTLPPNSEVTTDGSIINSETGATMGKVAQGAFGAYQIYQGAQQFKNDKVGGSLGVASGVANVGAAAGNSTAAAATGPLMIAKGVYDVQKSYENGGEGQRAGLTTLGAGLGSFAGPVGTVAGAIGGNVLGYGLQGNGIKNDLALAALGPVGWGVLAAKKTGLIKMHKTVLQTQNERLDKLNKQGITGLPQGLGEFGLTKEELVERETKNGGNAKFAMSRDEKDLVVNDTMNSLHNFELVGNDYMGKWNDEQRRKFNQLNLEAGNIAERKGGLYFTDKAKAEEIKKLVDTDVASTVEKPKTLGQAAAGPVAIPRPTPSTMPAQPPPGYQASPDGKGFVRRQL